MNNSIIGVVMVACAAGCAESQSSVTPKFSVKSGAHIAIETESGTQPVWSLSGARVDNVQSARLRGERGYLIAYRREGAIAVGALTPGHQAIGPLTTLSHAAQESEPIVASGGDGALVAWSERESNDQPWRVRLIRFVPGAGMVVLDEHTTGNAFSTAPTLAWERDAHGDEIVRASVTTVALGSVR